MIIQDKLIGQKAAVRSSWNRLEFNRNRDWDLYGYDFGIHPLNMAIGGIIPTKVTVLGGRSGTGKTALSSPIFEASLRRKSDGSRVEYLFFTWELDPSLVCDRMVCSQVGLTMRQLNQGAKLLSQTSLEKIKAAYAVADKYPITYHIVSTNIEEVKVVTMEFVKRCREKSKIEGVHVQPVIVVDYLNMAQFEEQGLRTYGIAGFMNGVKSLCNQEGVAAIIFAQISRETDKKSSPPDRADFSDSASIENACDNLIALWRPEYHGVGSIRDPETQLDVDSTNKMLIRVLKGRDYGTGDFLINCDIKYFRFWDLNQQWDYEYYKDYQNPEFWKKEFRLEEEKELAIDELPF